MSVDKELNALVRLFEDDDPIVMEAVNKRLLSRGHDVLNDLTSMFYEEKDEDTQDFIGERIAMLVSEFAYNTFISIAKVDEPDLASALFYATSIACIDLDYEEYNNMLLTMTEDIKREVSDNMTAYERFKIFNHIFYHRLKFTSRSYPVTNKKTTLIVPVLKNRHGSELPISLAYYLLARASGISIWPMVFPGGIVPCYAENGSPLFYIDIIRDGEIFSKDRLKGFLREKGFDVDEKDFKVENDKVLVRIYLELLYVAYSKEDELVGKILLRAIKELGGGRFLNGL